MLVLADQTTKLYKIAVTEATSSDELVADISYLVDAPPGNLIFDFTHSASSTMLVASGVQAQDLRRLPNNFGFRPLDRIVEQVSFIGRLVEMPLFSLNPHTVSAILPTPTSHVGKFFAQLGLPELLNEWRVNWETKAVWEPKGALDNDDRRIPVPLTDIRANIAGMPDVAQIAGITNKISDALNETFHCNIDALPKMLSDIIEGVVTLLHEGLITAIYFPKTGYFELSMMNRVEGALGATPDDQIQGLVNRLEAAPVSFEKLHCQGKRCFGTFQISNGSASILVGADGSFTCDLEHTGLPCHSYPGTRATVVLQLPPQYPILWEPFARERVATLWSVMLN